MLQAQELSDFHKERLEQNNHLTDNEKEALKPLGIEVRVDKKNLLPGYMRKLTAGYEYRTYWFEIFESIRKVLLVGVPAAFPDRGGNAQLVWGLLVCFLTFGAYMLYAPFIRDSDDQLQQLAQFQIFLTLVASIGLRMTPPSQTLATMMSVLFVFIPIIAILMETPLVDQLRGGYRMLRQAARRCMKLRRRVTPHDDAPSSPPKYQVPQDSPKKYQVAPPAPVATGEETMVEEIDDTDVEKTMRAPSSPTKPSKA